MDKTRPLLLLDVDGPLNPFAASNSKRGKEFRRHTMRPKGWEDRPLKVWLNPDHGSLLTAFAAVNGMELAWATTWEHDANVWIGPHIGLPELPVIEWGYRATHWKFNGVLDFAEGRPLAWFDDDFRAHPKERAWFEARRGDTPTLLHGVDPKIGITAGDLTTVQLWVTSEVAA